MEYFSDNYEEARSKFIATAGKAGATLYSLPLSVRGPMGEDLSIDLAVLGDLKGEKILLHSSGIHGVEGFAGSAVQVAALAQGVARPPGVTIIFVHILNPFGMAYSRRVNESNVDLNRNFLRDGEAYAGADENYGRLDPFLNQPGPRILFWPQLLVNLARFGFESLKRAVVQGQYDYPEGLFYGGATLEEGPRLLKAWLQQNITAPKRAMIIDVHTGLGRFGEEVLFCHGNQPAPALGKKLTGVDEPNGYLVRGGLESLSAEVFGAGEWLHITEEFGTYPMAKILKALRAESAEFREHRRAGPAGRALQDIMSPRNRRWRGKAVTNGLETLKRSLEWLAAR